MFIALSIVFGLILLVGGAEALVRGSSRLALAMGVPPLIIGLTVVAFGTSAPELAVSVRAALAGEAGVGLGNVFGSNIVNVLLILGVSALITPLVVSDQLIKFDVPIMITVTAASLLMAWDAAFSRLDGIILVIGLGLYMVLQVYLGRSGVNEIKDLIGEDLLVDEVVDGVPVKHHATIKTFVVAILQCVFGLAGLIFGAHFLVEGAVSLAVDMGVSDEIIGLTVVAIGTSLPEIVTSLVAAARGQRDLAVGNVIGSNLFNLLAVLGISSIVAPEPIEVARSLFVFDMPVMLAAAIICLPIFMTGKVVSRLEGGFMLLCFVAYNAYQVYSLGGAGQ